MSPGGAKVGKVKLHPLGAVEPHLLCEGWTPSTRRRLLRRLQEERAAGNLDPEMLYLGARQAVSLGLARDAMDFLDPLRANDFTTVDDLMAEVRRRMLVDLATREKIDPRDYPEMV